MSDEDQGPAGDPPRSADLEALVDAVTAVRAGPSTFTAASPDFWDGDRVFGGMVVAQALSAALQTVDPSVAVHSLHGYFLRPTRPGAPVSLAVDHLRDGRSFALRQVRCEVDGKQTFTMTCSFHVPEEGDEYQMAMPDGAGDPELLAPSPTPIPFELRELGPTDQRPDGSFASTRRVWIRTSAPLPDLPGLHACLLTYLSDMTGAAFRPLSLGVWGVHTDASLDHALWFHRPARADQWLFYDLQALVNAGGRSTVRGLLYSEDGALVLSMAQELLIRELENPRPETRPDWSTRQL